MKAIKLFLITSILLFISGCAPKTVYVPQKCYVPFVEYPDIDNKQYDDNASIIRKTLTNYVKMKEYAEKLVEASKVCQ